MFKRLKDRLAEVGEEVKKDPRFVNSLASVNQLAHQVEKILQMSKVNLLNLQRGSSCVFKPTWLRSISFKKNSGYFWLISVTVVFGWFFSFILFRKVCRGLIKKVFFDFVAFVSAVKGTRTGDWTDGIWPLSHNWMYPKAWNYSKFFILVIFFQTYSAISKNENSGSRESLPSQFPATGSTDLDNGSSGHRRTFSDQARSLLRISIRFNLVSLLNAAYQPSAQIAEKLTFAVVTVQWLAWLPCHLKVMDWIRFLIPSIIIFSWEPAVWIGLVSSDSERDFKGWRD